MLHLLFEFRSGATLAWAGKYSFLLQHNHNSSYLEENKVLEYNICQFLCLDNREGKVEKASRYEGETRFSSGLLSRNSPALAVRSIQTSSCFKHRRSKKATLMQQLKHLVPAASTTRRMRDRGCNSMCDLQLKTAKSTLKSKRRLKKESIMFNILSSEL